MSANGELLAVPESVYIKTEEGNPPLTSITPPGNSTVLFEREGIHRTDTPETFITDLSCKPDITILCEKCNTFLGIRTLLDHRAVHKALEKLRYKSQSRPRNTDSLLHRRNALIQRLKEKADAKDCLPDPKDILKINEAYEVLKSDLDDTYDDFRQMHDAINTHVNSVALNCSPECVYAVGIAASGNEKWKSVMEDTRVYQDFYGGDDNKCFLGLYDGHHGRFAAEVAASELHRLLLNELLKFDPKTKSVEVHNMADASIDISQYIFERPVTRESEHRRVSMYNHSLDVVQQIVKMCEEKYEQLMQEKGSNFNEKQQKLDSKKRKYIENPFAAKISAAYKKVYHLMDILLSYGKDECSKVRWSGCSALDIIIQNLKQTDEMGDDNLINNNSDEEDVLLEEKNDKRETSTPEVEHATEKPKKLGQIHLANSGNVQAVLVRGNRAYRISKDHTPKSSKETTRILREGGTLSDSARDCRVNGILSATRGLGNHGDKKLKACVIVEPYTTCVPIDEYAQFLIIASNGVWEIFSEHEAASLLLKILPCNQVPQPLILHESVQSLIMKQVASDHQANTDTTQNESRQRKVSFPSSFTTPKIAETSTPIVEVIDQTKNQKRGQHSAPGKDVDGTNIHETDSNEGLLPDSQSGNSSKGWKKRGMHLDVDMRTEAGSHLGEVSEGESGNEADIDTDFDIASSFIDPANTTENGDRAKDALHREYAKAMSEYLVQAALLAGAKDNVTAMVVLLPGSKL